MNYRDIEMLNQSMSGLGDTLLRNRMMAEQKAERAQSAAERAQDRGDRLAAQKYNQEAEKERLNQQILDRLANNKIRELQEIRGEKQDAETAVYRKDTLTAQNKQIEASSQRASNEEANRAAKIASDSLRQSKEDLLQYMDLIANQVKDGKSNDYANDHVLGFFNSLPDVQQKAMATSPLYQMIKDKSYNWNAHPTQGGRKEKGKDEDFDTEVTTSGETPDPSKPGHVIPYKTVKTTRKIPKGSGQTPPPPGAPASPEDPDLLKRFSVKPLNQDQDPNLNVTMPFPQ